MSINISDPASLKRSNKIEWREIGSQTFLAANEPGPIHHLDEMAAAIWRLLATPMREPDIVEIFKAAFPDQPQDAIERDIRGFLADMLDKGLLVPSDE